ncbi:MAG TPA: hypothetical protein VN709_10045 [Terriglobales bacterium]|nr:hypothetical protein [Terriglobales bacterium]
MRFLLAAFLLIASLAASPLPAAPPGGTVRALAADPFQPGRVLLGTTTGLVFVSADAGGHWQFESRVANHDDWVVATLIADPAQHGVWFAGLWSWGQAGGGVFRSSDDGHSWQPLWQGHAVRALAQAPSDPHTLVAATLDGVYRSQDSGQQWSLISPAHDRELTNIESVAIDPQSADEIYVGTWHLPWKTVNGGHDWWQMREGVIDDSDVFSIAVDRSHPETVYLSACSGIYRSDNKGNLFAKIQGIPYTARRTPALVQDPNDAATIYAGTTQGLWVTHDHGGTWARISSADLRINSVLLLPAGRILLGTDFAGVIASSDSGRTFAAANDGFSNRQVAAVADSPDGRYVAVTGDLGWGGVFLDAAGSWKQLPQLPQSSDAYSLHWSSAGLLAATSHGVYLLGSAQVRGSASARGSAPVRGAERWQLVRTAPHDHVYQLAGPGTNSLEVRAATQSGLYQSADGGKSWSWMPSAPAPLYLVLQLPPMGDKSWLFVAGNGYVLRSPDGGHHFEPGRLSLDGPGVRAVIRQITWAPGGHDADSAPLILAATTRGLYESRDWGATWTLGGHGLPAMAMASVQVQGDRLIALTETVGTAFASDDDGLTWRPTSLEPEREALVRAGNSM